MELIQPAYGLILWSVFSICLLFFWVLAIVSISKSDFKDTITKTLWILVVIFLPLIGTLLYFSQGRNHRINNNQSSN